MPNKEIKKEISISLDGNKAIDQTGGAIATIMQMIFPARYQDAKKKDAQLRFDIRNIEEGAYSYRDQKLVACASNLILEDTRNIVNTLEKTAAKVKNKSHISYDDQNKEFLDAWKGIVRNISSEQLQEVFASLLAQELDNPNTVSIRTLKYVESMSTNEAKNFVNATKFIIPHQSIILHPAINDKMLLSHSQMQSLVDCGMIISYSPGIYRSTKLYKHVSNDNLSMFNTILQNYAFCILENDCKNENTPKIIYWEISGSAKELYTVTVEGKLSEIDVQKIGCILLSQNKNITDKVICKEVSYDGESYKFLDKKPIIISSETIDSICSRDS